MEDLVLTLKSVPKKQGIFWFHKRQRERKAGEILF